MAGFLKRMFMTMNPPNAPPTPGVKPLRFGILSTADICVQALIQPAHSLPDIEVVAIGGRAKEKVEAFAKKHGIRKVHSGPEGYQNLVDDPDIDAVYIPLPNTLHYEWTIKALLAGKHVLVEKPIANTPEEALRMHELAEGKGLVLLEAMHIRFHPAIQRVKSILTSGEHGAIKKISVKLLLPKGTVKYSDGDFDLGKGSIMDIGCYDLEILRFLTSSDPISVESASCEATWPGLENLDTLVTSTLSFANGITADITCNINTPFTLGFIPNFDFSVHIECERGTIKMSNFMVPSLFHSITVKETGGHSRTEKAFRFTDGDEPSRGEEWWTTFHHQLTAFRDRALSKEPRTWYSKEDSVAEAAWLQKIYTKMGMGVRPYSEYFLKTRADRAQ
ncbi:hypothetical protein NLJ89_g4333 [Agrocybe chaxingu]|uniref:D-xylose 1-dehydrogenase (NADP(+), D-xylono-1,5-lactone-forming) n=1 Tax=Agrocybe chaxingu TaxID=84603 RepID=A0A9W8MWM3_9AGAR|nr:hypothetical protein NLJ89_g4333 [Agrocybe chaxingu]